MTPRALANSPLAIAVLAGFAMFTWTCGYEATQGEASPGPVASTVGAEEPAQVEEEPAVEVAEVEGPAEEEAPLFDPAELRLLSELDPENPYGLPIAVQDQDGHSLARFHAALERAARGEGKARAIFYGASHVASDLFTGLLRRELQARFGDGGHGFVLPAHPWRSYRHRGVQIESTRRLWDATRVRANSRDVDYFGLHGVYVESERSGARGEVRTTHVGDVGRAVGVFDLYYMAQPDGGDFDVYIDGTRARRVETRADEAGPGYATFRVEDGEHELEVRVRGNGPVRIFGVSLEREQPGFVLDTLGINGARVRAHLLWEDSLYREHLRRRDPDLVVLAYGTNESGDDSPIERYEERLNQVVARVRETVPDASCLLVGPSDRPVRVDRETFEDRPRTAQIVEVQHRVALAHGCGFFDLVAFSGGPLSMVEWAAAEPPFAAPDHVHYTRRGYTRLGEIMLDALMEGYEGPDASITAAPNTPPVAAVQP